MFTVFINLQLKPEEVTNITKDFNEPGTLAPIGLFLATEKYMVIQGEPGVVIRGKKVILFHTYDIIIVCIYSSFISHHFTLYSNNVGLNLFS